MEPQTQTQTPTSRRIKQKKTTSVKKKKTAKQKMRTGSKKSKITGPSVAFNISVPAQLLPKIDKAAKTFAKKHDLNRVSRSGYVRELILSAIR